MDRMEMYERLQPKSDMELARIVLVHEGVVPSGETVVDTREHAMSAFILADRGWTIGEQLVDPDGNPVDPERAFVDEQLD